MRKRIIFSLIIVLMLCSLTGCGYNGNKPPDSKVATPLVGEFVTVGGSKLTFTDDGDEDLSTGNVLVELSNDTEYLLEGRENNIVYRYIFSMNNLPANYDVADDFQLSNGDEWFAMCHSRYTGNGEFILKPYLPSGDEIIFERVVDHGEGGTYNLVPKKNGYFEVIKGD